MPPCGFLSPTTRGDTVASKSPNRVCHVIPDCLSSRNRPGTPGQGIVILRTPPIIPGPPSMYFEVWTAPATGHRVVQHREWIDGSSFAMCVWSMLSRMPASSIWPALLQRCIQFQAALSEPATSRTLPAGRRKPNRGCFRSHSNRQSETDTLTPAVLRHMPRSTPRAVCCGLSAAAG